MAQSQVSDDGKYVRSGHALTWTWIAFTVAALAVALAIGIFRIGAYQSAIDAVRSAVNGSASRSPIAALQDETPMLIREGARISVPDGSPLRGKLTIGPVAQREIQRKLILPAVVEADPARTVKVLPPVTGRVTDLKVQLGERVVQGQELAVIDSGDLAQAYSDIEKARSVLTFTKKALDRQLGLEKAGGAAIKDREQAQNDYDQAVAELERAQSRLRAMGVPAEPPPYPPPLAGEGRVGGRLLTLKAPAAGSVIDLQVARGAFLNDLTAAIMTIANLGTVWVTANVPEKDTALVTTGQDVDVVFSAYPGEVFAGKVLFISDVLDPDTRRTKIRIAFDNPAMKLKPNMFADATFLAPRQMMQVVPTQALVLKDETDRVFVEVAPWTFEARPVEVGFQQNDQAVVEHGLKAGERIVVKGGVLLND
jgi:cobalt-zinc-cadmium efflux system membrane fusion protein